ncbi:hypothetical protein [Consotaella salsifontis]|uniref:Uncharacterized protein n=1 Tax=Consotaella salsifontis TaxID=1365950 RepID=A0A1T4SS98_9HYPH|nr:hypothetical protein [Consotaella salsifontis]SKA31115.1 hypothetical protein SAMN05428963_113119 [Consotaella salsifontis]
MIIDGEEVMSMTFYIFRDKLRYVLSEDDGMTMPFETEHEATGAAVNTATDAGSLYTIFYCRP